MLLTFYLMIYEKSIEKLELKIDVEDHFDVFSQGNRCDTPAQPPGENGYRSRKALHGGEVLHCKPQKGHFWVNVLIFGQNLKILVLT